MVEQALDALRPVFGRMYGSGGLSPSEVPTPLMKLRLATAAAAVCALFLLPAAAGAAIPGAIPNVEYEGMQKQRYKIGPFKIEPGQNSIAFRSLPARFKPTVPGYITRFEPNIERPDGTVPGVDVIHLHHAVWLMRGYPNFAAGEEKTIFQMPKGYGYKYDPSDPWGMTDMIHNLMPNEDAISITWEIDFVPLDAPGARGMVSVEQQWMDVAGISAYPVFDVLRSMSSGGRYTFPDAAEGEQEGLVGGAQTWTVPRDITLVGTGGHLHPGGLWTDLKVTRNGVTRDVFRSEAKYWEPAGPVSWDMAMTVTGPQWRVQLRRGDVLSVHAAYEAKKASWYESMGIMNVWWAPGEQPGARDPFAAAVDTRGRVSHQRLPENDNHGGRRTILPDARKLRDGPRRATVTISKFLYANGDLSNVGRKGRPPVVKPGQSLRFKNADAADDIYHTITACRAPCNKDTGIAYPLANGPVDFDSGELGFGPSFATPTENTDVWETPKSLKPGTYTFFCRVHPFMRGAFRVKGAAKKRAAAG